MSELDFMNYLFAVVKERSLTSGENRTIVLKRAIGYFHNEMEVMIGNLKTEPTLEAWMKEYDKTEKDAEEYLSYDLYNINP